MIAKRILNCGIATSNRPEVRHRQWIRELQRVWHRKRTQGKEGREYLRSLILEIRLADARISQPDCPIKELEPVGRIANQYVRSNTVEMYDRFCQNYTGDIMSRVICPQGGGFGHYRDNG